MFVFCRPEDAVAEHERLLAHEKALLSQLELPFRVIDVATGDLGSAAGASSTARPGCRRRALPRGHVDLELHRLPGPPARIRSGAPTDGPAGRDPQRDASPPRPIVALLENHQQADGSVTVPQVLQPYVGALDVSSRSRDRPRLAAALVALDIDGTLLKWSRVPGRPTSRSRPPSTPPYAARTTPARTSCWPPAARRTADPSPSSSTWAGAGLAGGATARWSPRPAARRRRRGDLRRRAGGRAAARAPGRAGRGRGARRRLPRNRPFPAGELAGDRSSPTWTTSSREPVTRVVIRNPENEPRRLPRGGRAGSACTTSTTPSATPPGSTSLPTA